MRLTVQPLTRGRWDDLVELFSRPGGSIVRGCWCMYYRKSGGSGGLGRGKANKRAMKALELLPVRLVTLRGVLALRSQRLSVHIEFHGGQRREKGLHDPRIYRIGRHILTDGDAILLPQVVTEILGAPFILHHHLVATGAAVDEAMQ